MMSSVATKITNIKASKGSVLKDGLNQTPVMAQYHAIKEQHKDCLLFFRLGDFYELFYEDAHVASKALDIVLTQRYRDKTHPVPMCGVPVHSSEIYMARLIKKGFRVAVCEQTGTLPATSSKKNPPLHREVVRIMTPGTLTEDSLLYARDHHFLMAIWDKEEMCAVACVDISTGDFWLESAPLGQLPSLLERWHPKEIIVPEHAMQWPIMNHVWPEWKHTIYVLPPARFDRGDDRLKSFFNVQTTQSFGQFSRGELACAGALLDYVLITQKKTSVLVGFPKKIHQHDEVDMDRCTRKQLELTETFDGQKQGSLLDTIDRTVTAMGGRLLAFRLAHLTRDLPTISQRQEAVHFFLRHPEARETMRELLRQLPDMDRALSRLLFGRGSPKDLGMVRDGLKLLPLLATAVVVEDAALPQELCCGQDLFVAHSDLSDELVTALVDELPSQWRDQPVFRLGYDTALDQARQKSQMNQTDVQALQKQYVQETGIANLKIQCNNVIGYFIEVSPQAAAKVPYYFTLRQTLTSALRYTTPELAKIEQESTSSMDEAAMRERLLADRLIQRIQQKHEVLRQTIKALAVYDVALAMAELADTQNYVCPIVDHSRTLNIVKGRHPVVEKNTSVPFVCNDCLLNSDKPFWLITGPNMAGKSTFLRQNALIAILAHMGSFVPAEHAHIGLIDRIYSRVGASDNLAKGQSTFMVEMVEMAMILNQATSDSLVIVDEVGRGTSTQDGLSIAYACAEHLSMSVQCRTLFSTHFHELASLGQLSKVALYTPQIQEWDTNIVFLYSIVPGVANRSYGVHVAKLAGFPPLLLQRAHSIVHSLELGHPFTQAVMGMADHVSMGSRSVKADRVGRSQARLH